MQKIKTRPSDRRTGLRYLKFTNPAHEGFYPVLFHGRSPGFGLITYLSHLPESAIETVVFVTFVTHYSSGAATELHRFPYYPI